MSQTRTAAAVMGDPFALKSGPAKLLRWRERHPEPPAFQVLERENRSYSPGALVRCTLLVFPLVLCFGCVARPSLYERMSVAVKPGDGLQQTQLAHIGHVDTTEGRFEVAVQHLVLTGMLAPRGQTHLILFRADGKLAKQFWYPCFQNEPLWCEGGKLYIAGFAYVPGIPVDPQIASRFEPDEVATGNVVDFSHGISKAVIRRETRYGSSGGIEDVAAVRPGE